MKRAVVNTSRDPWPYEGPIARADGQRPFNHYLWPTESWWAYHEFGHREFSGRFHFGIVALTDGRFAVEGQVWQIEENRDDQGRPVVFDLREDAIRTAVARFIRLCRNARRWSGTPDRLSQQCCQKAITWALGVAGRPAAKLRPLAVPRVKIGLPLFDVEVGP